MFWIISLCRREFRWSLNNCSLSFQDLVNQNDPKELLSPEEYEELKLEIFRERKISTEAVADIKLTEEEIQAIRKKTKERRQVFHSKTEKDITDRWTFEEGVRFKISYRIETMLTFYAIVDQATLFSC